MILFPSLAAILNNIPILYCPPTQPLTEVKCLFIFISGKESHFNINTLNNKEYTTYTIWIYLYYSDFSNSFFYYGKE